MKFLRFSVISLFLLTLCLRMAIAPFVHARSLPPTYGTQRVAHFEAAREDDDEEISCPAPKVRRRADSDSQTPLLLSIISLNAPRLTPVYRPEIKIEFITFELDRTQLRPPNSCSSMTA